MEQATITVKYRNARKPNGKFNNVKDQTGNVYFCEDDIFNELQSNQTATVAFEIQKWTKGPVNVLQQVLDGKPRVNGTEAPQPTLGKPAEPMYRSKSQQESCEIFVNGVIQNCFHGTASLPGVREMASIIYNLRCAWHAAMAKDIQAIPPKADPQVEPQHDPNRAPF